MEADAADAAFNVKLVFAVLIQSPLLAINVAVGIVKDVHVIRAGMKKEFLLPVN
ncbi:MAG: hypothetical protein FD123_2961 [Bacteroidetes bacterium]|nr:MAG: hypothetical protein FD123_2961 [Bacteroidota bacterium]